MIAKIAMQAADLYADALSNMQVGSIKNMWDKVREDYHGSFRYFVCGFVVFYETVCCSKRILIMNVLLISGLDSDSGCKAGLHAWCCPASHGACGSGKQELRRNGCTNEGMCLCVKVSCNSCLAYILSLCVHRNPSPWWLMQRREEKATSSPMYVSPRVGLVVV